MKMNNAKLNKNPDIVMVECAFGDSPARYDFMCHRKLAENLDEGDIVIVDTCRGIATATVTMIIDPSQFQPGIKYKWLFQRVNTGYLAKLRSLV